MDITLDYATGLYSLNAAAFKLDNDAPPTPQQTTSRLRQWLRRRSSAGGPSSPDQPAKPSSSQRRNQPTDFGAPEAASTPSQSSLLRTNGTDAVTTTQDAINHLDEDAPPNLDERADDQQPPAPHKADMASPLKPPQTAAADEATTSSGFTRPSMKGRVLQALGGGRRRSSGSIQEAPGAPQDDDPFSTQQSLASSSQISGQRASLTAQLARGESPDEALHSSLLDGSHHSGTLLLGRTSASSRSGGSQQVNAAAYVGLWRKNVDDSDGGAGVEDLLGMPRLQRMVRQRTMLLEIKDSGDALHFVWHVRLNGGKEILKSECYPREGPPVEAPRRDGREGSQRATAGMSRGYLQVKAVQDEPYAAMFQDRYVLSTHGNRLRIEHKMQLMNGGSAEGPVRYTSVWHRVWSDDTAAEKVRRSREINDEKRDAALK